MHPAMALWIWSVSMSRVWQTSLMGADLLPQLDEKPRVADPAFVRANNYLYSEVAKNPLPDSILDRLADLYWTERDSDLAI
ncbi:hypothetical protein [Hyphomicrobium sp.]|uniref:hypothetical protein n=1 Tax=Hyphomicrobium sp. TaxID=82 RepID=UPI001DBA616D|nr:hypothetical protein [Hyphomicrobium sp.]MBY0559530.1 hypothetical protein [Hyphomicrobium sp.]